MRRTAWAAFSGPGVLKIQEFCLSLLFIGIFFFGGSAVTKNGMYKLFCSFMVCGYYVLVSWTPRTGFNQRRGKRGETRHLFSRIRFRARTKKMGCLSCMHFMVFWWNPHSPRIPKFGGVMIQLLFSPYTPLPPLLRNNSIVCGGRGEAGGDCAIEAAQPNGQVFLNCSDGT